jgi:hypothetical protein
MYPNADGYAFDFDQNLRGDTLRVTPTHAQVASSSDKDKAGPEYDVAHHDAYPNADGYAFDFDKNLRGDALRVTPTHAQKGDNKNATAPAQSLAQGPEFNVAHHDMYPNADGYAFDFD